MSFIGCLVLGIEDGIIAAIALSVVITLYEAVCAGPRCYSDISLKARPRHVKLSLDPSSNHYEPITSSEDTDEGALLMRVNGRSLLLPLRSHVISGPLLFPNGNYLADRVRSSHIAHLIARLYLLILLSWVGLLTLTQVMSALAKRKSVRVLLLDFAPVSYSDFTGAQIFDNLVDDLLKSVSHLMHWLTLNAARAITSRCLSLL